MTEQNQNQVTIQDSEIESIRTSSESTSNKIRQLSAKGLSRSDVSKILNIRYQHVRNVLVTPLKKSQ